MWTQRHTHENPVVLGHFWVYQFGCNETFRTSPQCGAIWGSPVLAILDARNFSQAVNLDTRRASRRQGANETVTNSCGAKPSLQRGVETRSRAKVFVVLKWQILESTNLDPGFGRAEWSLKHRIGPFGLANHHSHPLTPKP